MRVYMGESEHLTVEFGEGDSRVVVVDKKEDVRICDGKHVVKVRFRGKEMADIIVDDVFVHNLR